MIIYDDYDNNDNDDDADDDVNAGIMVIGWTGLVSWCKGVQSIKKLPIRQNFDYHKLPRKGKRGG